MIASEPARLTKRARVFYWQKRSIPAVRMKHPRFCVLSASFCIIKAIERTTADSITCEREREWQLFLNEKEKRFFRGITTFEKHLFLNLFSRNHAHGRHVRYDLGSEKPSTYPIDCTSNTSYLLCLFGIRQSKINKSTLLIL